MTEDRNPKASEEPAAAASAEAKQRKKRKWDQPAEHFVSTAAAMVGVPLSVDALPSIPLPGVAMYPGAPFSNIVPATYALPLQIASSVPQSSAVVVQKLNQAKIQDELIAREIVINDAESSIRYKLTKRQTQEEIQRSTGAIVITRGKYRPPNEPPDGEKPLYLHISAGSHLKDTAERIKAVDRAASMVEEVLKQGHSLQAASIPSSPIQSDGQVTHLFSTSVFLGFDADPTLNIAARIRGPNDQYINHIMNETGVTVVLRGKNSGNPDVCHAEASQQSLHLYLSSMHTKNLEAAKILAENLLDTIAAECGASRISSLKVYSAVPPPQQLLAVVQNPPRVSDVHCSSAISSPTISDSTVASQCFVPTGVPGSIGAGGYPQTLQSRVPLYHGIPPNNLSYATPPVNRGAFYNGYGGIYPQATPLEQVAFALIQAPSSTSAVVSSTTPSMSTVGKASLSSNLETDKHPPQKRKFQEAAVLKGPAAENQNSQQGSEFLKTGLEDSGKMNSLSVPPPKKLVEPDSNGMLPPAPRSMLPPPNRMLPPRSSKNMPPPPPKFTSDEMSSNTENRKLASDTVMGPPGSSNTSSVSLPKFSSAQSPIQTRKEKSITAPISDTLLKLVDYGEDDDDDDDDRTDVLGSNAVPSSGQKPFWAV